jgi:hypothetical protein
MTLKKEGGPRAGKTRGSKNKGAVKTRQKHNQITVNVSKGSRFVLLKGKTFTKWMSQFFSLVGLRLANLLQIKKICSTKKIQKFGLYNLFIFLKKIFSKELSYFFYLKPCCRE